MWIELLTAVGTAVSPLIAVQVTQWNTDRKEVRKRKIGVFHMLMLTRDAWLSPDHVRALNLIPIEFYGDRKAKPTLEAWRAYHAHLNMPLLETEAEKFLWSNTRVELFVTMLHAMAKYFKYDFDPTFIRTTAYTPRAHGLLEDESIEMRRLLLEVLRGQRSLPIAQTPVAQQPRFDTPSITQTVAPLSAPTSADEVAELKRQLEAPSEPTAPKK
jgi:hypothetical protein